MTVQVDSAKQEKAHAPYNFIGCWRNQHGSERNIKEIKDGKLSGTFKTGVGAHDPEEEFELTGFVSDGLIAFTVNFGKYNSLTSWSGQHSRSKASDKIETMWHLARTLPENAEKDCLWAGVWAGADTFVRSKAGSPRNLEKIDRPPFVPYYPFHLSKK